jgi:hypothetical protein
MYEGYACFPGASRCAGVEQAGKPTTLAAPMNTDYRPIRGVYAAGELVGGLFYFNYRGGPA